MRVVFVPMIVIMVIVVEVIAFAAGVFGGTLLQLGGRDEAFGQSEALKGREEALVVG